MKLIVPTLYVAPDIVTQSPNVHVPFAATVTSFAATGVHTNDVNAVPLVSVVSIAEVRLRTSETALESRASCEYP